MLLRHGQWPLHPATGFRKRKPPLRAVHANRILINVHRYAQRRRRRLWYLRVVYTNSNNNNSNNSFNNITRCCECEDGSGNIIRCVLLSKSDGNTRRHRRSLITCTSVQVSSSPPVFNTTTPIPAAVRRVVVESVK